MNHNLNCIADCGGPLSRYLIVWAAIAGLSVNAGCNSSDGDRVRVAGTVTYAGNPVPDGRIDFVPAPGHEATGPGGFALIEDGTFDTRREGRGCGPGIYLARMAGFADDAPKIDEVSHGTILFEGYEIEIEIQPGQEDILLEVPQQKNRR